MRLTAALMLVACVFGAHAASGSSGGSHGKKEATPAEAQSSGPRVPSVAMPKLVAPIVIEGQLYHYAYLSVQLQLHDDDQKTMVLEKIPYLQDAFLRHVHEMSIVLDGDPDRIDKEGLARRLVEVSAEVLGPGVVENVEFLNVARPNG